MLREVWGDGETAAGEVYGMGFFQSPKMGVMETCPWLQESIAFSFIVGVFSQDTRFRGEGQVL